MSTKTEIAEDIQDCLQHIILTYEDNKVFNREFKDLLEDFKVKIQESIEESIEHEEQEMIEIEEEETEENSIGISMEGE